MRRSLVITDESAGHPFRQSLPRHVCHGKTGYPRDRRVQRPAPGRMQAMRLAMRRQIRRSPVSIQDVKNFLLAYCACFVAVMAFIS